MDIMFEIKLIDEGEIKNFYEVYDAEEATGIFESMLSRCTDTAQVILMTRPLS